MHLHRVLFFTATLALGAVQARSYVARAPAGSLAQEYEHLAARDVYYQRPSRKARRGVQASAHDIAGIIHHSKQMDSHVNKAKPEHDRAKEAQHHIDQANKNIKSGGFRGKVAADMLPHHEAKKADAQHKFNEHNGNAAQSERKLTSHVLALAQASKAGEHGKKTKRGINVQRRGGVKASAHDIAGIIHHSKQMDSHVNKAKPEHDKVKEAQHHIDQANKNIKSGGFRGKVAADMLPHHEAKKADAQHKFNEHNGNAAQSERKLTSHVLALTQASKAGGHGKRN